HLQQPGKKKMNFVARAAAGLILLAAAAPTTSVADDMYNAMNYYNERNARSAPDAQRARRAQNPSAARTQRNAQRTRPATRLQRKAQQTKTAARPFAGLGAGNPHWIAVAQRYKGTNPTGRKS